MRRRLDAAELADAALSAAVVLALLTVGRLLAAGTFFQVIGTVVMAALAARRRFRAVAVGTAAAMAMALLLGGIGPITQAFVAGLFGWTGGVALRRRMGLVRHVLLSVSIAWPIVSAVTVGFLWVFADTRDLSLENGRNQWLGMARILESVGLDGIADVGTDFVDWSITNWWVMVPALQLGVTIGYALIVRRLGRAVLDRLQRSMGHPWHPPVDDDRPPRPLPVTLGPELAVENRPPVAVGPTTIEPAEAIVVLGDNGVGKTTLLETLADIHRATGLDRPGAAGLGHMGGTALIGQAPHTQILGLRVVDDLRWGLEPHPDQELERILSDVGLAGRAQQPTAQLSGGELQRLAVAGVIARRPALVLSDESTAMLDHDGRHRVLGLLRSLHGDGATVVHSTHLTDEHTDFDRRLDLGGRPADPPQWRSSPALFRKVVLRAEGVGHVHDAGSPWAARALDGVDLSVERGELAVISGPNGSGKTTLVRLLAGLAQPTEGTITLDDDPLRGPTRDIGVMFQHARLQLLRATIRAEVASLAGTHEPAVIEAAMARVGFEPADGALRVAELSGGQQRRVLLAGLSARACKVVIMDEPLAGLDAAGRTVLTSIIDAMLAAGTAVVVVSHDPAWAAERADRIVRLDRPVEAAR